MRKFSNYLGGAVLSKPQRPKLTILRTPEADASTYLMMIGDTCRRNWYPKKPWVDGKDGYRHGYERAAQYAAIFPTVPNHDKINLNCLKNINMELRPANKELMENVCSMMTIVIYYYTRKVLSKNKNNKGAEQLKDSKPGILSLDENHNVKFLEGKHAEMELLEILKDPSRAKKFSNFIIDQCHPKASKDERNIERSGINDAIFHLYTRLLPCPRCRETLETVANARFGSVIVSYTVEPTVPELGQEPFPNFDSVDQQN